MSVTTRTLLNSLRAYLGQNDRYCREVTASLSNTGVEVHFSRGRPSGEWGSPERKFVAELEDVAIQCGYYLREVDDKVSHARERT